MRVNICVNSHSCWHINSFLNENPYITQSDMSCVSESAAGAEIPPALTQVCLRQLMLAVDSRARGEVDSSQHGFIVLDPQISRPAVADDAKADERGSGGDIIRGALERSADLVELGCLLPVGVPVGGVFLGKVVYKRSEIERCVADARAELQAKLSRIMQDVASLRAMSWDPSPAPAPVYALIVVKVADTAPKTGTSFPAALCLLGISPSAPHTLREVPCQVQRPEPPYLDSQAAAAASASALAGLPLVSSSPKDAKQSALASEWSILRTVCVVDGPSAAPGGSIGSVFFGVPGSAAIAGPFPRPAFAIKDRATCGGDVADCHTDSLDIRGLAAAIRGARAVWTGTSEAARGLRMVQLDAFSFADAPSSGGASSRLVMTSGSTSQGPILGVDVVALIPGPDDRDDPAATETLSRCLDALARRIRAQTTLLSKLASQSSAQAFTYPSGDCGTGLAFPVTACFSLADLAGISPAKSLKRDLPSPATTSSPGEAATEIPLSFLDDFASSHGSVASPSPSPSTSADKTDWAVLGACHDAHRRIARLLLLPAGPQALRISQSLPWSTSCDDGKSPAQAASTAKAVGAPSYWRHLALPAQPVASPAASKKLLNLHLLPPPPEDTLWAVASGRSEYFHYGQDGSRDSGWGCAYRTFMTIVSWYLCGGYVTRDEYPHLRPTGAPSHKIIQEALVRSGDKPSTFVGSSEWIGAVDLGICLSSLYGLSGRILPFRSGSEVAGAARQLLHHFATQGTPIMAGGNNLSLGILGVSLDELSGDVRFLILDPHYTGDDVDGAKIAKAGWCAWKKPSVFAAHTFYNLLLPQVPTSSELVRCS